MYYVYFIYIFCKFGFFYFLIAKLESLFYNVISHLMYYLFGILVQKREKKRHESILSEELVKVLKYLNQYLPAEHAIKYMGFDMARVSKRCVLRYKARALIALRNLLHN